MSLSFEQGLALAIVVLSVLRKFYMEYFYGLLNLDLLGYVIATLVMLQITMMAVTLYLHRDQAHRDIDLNPVLRHFFRFWIWCASHSPQIYGIKKVVFEGAELYRDAKNNRETVEKFGRGAPNDWLEKKIYLRVPYGGLIFMLAVDLLLFGVPGITIFAIQMMSMPLFAAGVINGLGHYTGYRNFECDDASTNLVPWAFLIGGEELHNNHHAFPTSAKFSVRRWEFDIGWLYITIFRYLGLAKVNKVAPRPLMQSEPDANMDLENLRAIIVNRMHVLRDYTKQVTVPIFKKEKALAAGDRAFRRAKKLFVRRPVMLDEAAKQRLGELLADNTALRTVVEFRERLSELWGGAQVSNETLLAQLRDWCAEAEASGIKVLEDFAQRLQSYHLAPA